MSAVRVTRGDGPVLVGLPRAGTDVPPGAWAPLDAEGRRLHDTDRHVGRLHEGLPPGLVPFRVKAHRCAIDASRSPTGESLHPAQATTGPAPETDLEGAPTRGDRPTPEEVADRVALHHAPCHAPCHAALAAGIARVRDRHGAVPLWAARSIRSRGPRLLDGTLPLLNAGPLDGRSCGAAAGTYFEAKAAPSRRWLADIMEAARDAALEGS